MLSSEYISAEDQQQWFMRLQQSTDNSHLVFYQNHSPIGILRFDHIGTEELSWGCYLGEERVWPGSGLLLEIAALDYAFNILLHNKLKAEVLEHNEPPIRMHLFFGYQEKASRAIIKDGQPAQLRVFEYAAADWEKNRTATLAKLPENIRLAADMITYE